MNHEEIKHIANPTVSVVMITYKHASFIAEAIEGVLMQECDFEVELIIADDCSPDNTHLVVEHYMNNHPNGHWIKYHRHSENKGMMPNFIWALQQAKGPFIALCEGDDYWTDPLKLQKQVDFLETNLDYSMVSHQFRILDFTNNNDGLFVENQTDEKPEYPMTLTVCFRAILIQDLQYNKFSTFRDTHLFEYLKTHGNWCHFNYYAADYRLHPGGITHGVSANTRALINYTIFKELLLINNSLQNQQKFYQIAHYMLHKKVRGQINNFHLNDFTKRTILYFFCYVLKKDIFLLAKKISRKFSFKNYILFVLFMISAHNNL